MTLSAFLLIVGGFACTALSMRKHQQQVFGTGRARRGRRVWRAAGWLLLGAALLPCIEQSGTGVGLVAWTGLLTVGALVVAMLLTYRPRGVFALAVAAPLLGIVAALTVGG